MAGPPGDAFLDHALFEEPHFDDDGGGRIPSSDTSSSEGEGDGTATHGPPPGAGGPQLSRRERAAGLRSASYDPRTGVFSTFSDAAQRQEKIRRANIVRHLQECSAEAEAAGERVADLELQVEACGRNLDSLRGQSSEAQAQAEAGATCAGGAAWQARLDALDREHDAQEDLGAALGAELTAARAVLAEAVARREQFEVLRGEVREAEMQDAREQAILSRLRRETEVQQASRHLSKRRQEDILMQQMVETLEQSNSQALDQAREAQAVTGLRAQSAQRRTRRKSRELRAQQEQRDTKRVESVLAFKRSQDAVAAEVRTQAVASRRRDEARRRREADERKQILREGGNPEAVFLDRRLKREAERRERQAEEERQAQEQRVVQKLMRERRQREAAKISVRPGKGKPRKGAPKRPTALPKNNIAHAAQMSGEALGAVTVDEEADAASLPDVEGEELCDGEPHGGSSDGEASASDSEPEPWDATDEYAEPDIPGAWGSDWQPPAVDTSPRAAPAAHRSTLRTRPLSKAEQDALARQLEAQKRNLAQPQVVGGREFKGVAFASKPAEVVFEDFEPGRTYRKRVVLTNISYGPNSFKLLPSPLGAIELQHTPSGALSPGLSTELVVIFSPRREEDVDTAITLLAQTGPVSIPVRCTTRKCEPQLSTTSLQFSRIQLGSTAKCSLKILNAGALPCPFHVRRRRSTDSSSSPGSGDSGSPIAVVKNPSGTVPAKGALSVGLEFVPTAPGSTLETFDVVTEGEAVDNLAFTVRGDCDDVAVFVDTSLIDLRICQFGQTYAGLVVVCNRSPTSSAKIRFEVPKKLRSFVQLSPRSGVVQANGSFKASVQFTPTAELLAAVGAGGGSGEEEGAAALWPVAFECKLVAESQPLPGSFTVKAQVTPAVLRLSTQSISFGEVAANESVAAPLAITNESALPQDFAFCNLPPYLVVEPGGGLGCILPFETVACDVILSPSLKPQDRHDRPLSATISLCYGGKTLPITCKAVCVSPPCTLSSACVAFPATAAGDESTTTLALRNHRSEAFRFELIVPDGIPVSFSPSSGTVGANARCPIRATFAPPAIAVGAAEDAEVASADVGVGDGVATAEEDPPAPELGATAATIAAFRNFRPTFDVHTIPCFFQRCAAPPDAAPYRNQDTQQLRVQLPVVAPSLLIEGAAGKDGAVAFPNLAIGRSEAIDVQIRNISDSALQLSSSVLDPSGPFRIVRALRSVPQQGTFTLKLAFEPKLPGRYTDSLQLITEAMSIKLRLLGEAITPSVVMSPDSELAVSDCWAGQSSSGALKLENTSSLPVTIRFQLASTQSREPPAIRVHRDQDTGLPVVERHGAFGTANFNGKPAFRVSPAVVSIPAGATTKVEVLFEPDHPSAHFFDTVLANLTDEVRGISVRVSGRAWPTNSGAFVSGLDEVDAPVCSDVLSRLAEPINTHKTVTFKACGGDGMSTRTLLLGAVARPNGDKKKAGADFQVQLLEGGDAFQVAATKVVADAGQAMPLKVKLKAPSGLPFPVGSIQRGVLEISAKHDGNTTVHRIQLVGHVLGAPL